MTPVFSSSECVISLVLSCFYWSEGGTPFLCFFCVSNCCLAERCYFSSFGLVFGWTSERSRFVYDTVFWRFAILDCSRFCWTLLFLEFCAANKACLTVKPL